MERDVAVKFLKCNFPTLQAPRTKQCDQHLLKQKPLDWKRRIFHIGAVSRIQINSEKFIGTEENSVYTAYTWVMRCTGAESEIFSSSRKTRCDSVALCISGRLRGQGDLCAAFLSLQLELYCRAAVNGSGRMTYVSVWENHCGFKVIG